MNEAFVFAVTRNDLAEEIFLDQPSAEGYAEDRYGSRQDGICVDDVRIVKCRLIPCA